MGLWLYCMIKNFCGIAACKGNPASGTAGGRLAMCYCCAVCFGQAIRVAGIVAFTLYYAEASKRLKVMAFATNRLFTILLADRLAE